MDGNLVNLTYLDTAPQLDYRGIWFPSGVWNATNVENLNGTLHVTNNQSSEVVFTFPVPAVAFYYYGIPRSRGGLYQICTDDCTSDSSFSIVDAFNATDNGQNPPVVLYNESFTTPGIHTVTLRNSPDPRGLPPGHSQLCVVSFVLTVRQNLTGTGQCGPQLSSSSSLIHPSTSSVYIKPTSPSGFQGTPAHISRGAIGGITLGTLALVSISAVALYYLYLRSNLEAKLEAAKEVIRNTQRLPECSAHNRPDMRTCAHSSESQSLWGTPAEQHNNTGPILATDARPPNYRGILEESKGGYLHFT